MTARWLALWLLVGASGVPASPALCQPTEARVPARPVAAQQDPVIYTIDLADARTQTIRVSMSLPAVEGPVEVALPVWRPGRYAVLDAAGTIRTVTAATTGGAPVLISKADKTTWLIEANQGAGEVGLVVSYDVYANSLADRTRHADDTHAFISPSAVLLYAPAFRDRPVEVRLVGLHEGWSIATALAPGPGGPGTFRAPNYDALVDAPIEAGRHERFSFQAGGVRHDVALWGASPDEFDADRMGRDFAALVETQRAIFGELPYDRYLYIVHAGPGFGGGTEHFASFVAQTGPLALAGSKRPAGAGGDAAKAYRGLLSLISHEHFHTWNVKRFRPRDLTPYDYRREQYTSLLWLVEGTTSYYDDLCCARAGVWKPSDYLTALGDTITGEAARPGRHVQSLAESSFDAWIKFNRATPDSANATVSFYSKGALVSFLLDMRVRESTAGARSLDDVMRELYRRFPPTGPGYTPGDLLGVLRELTGEDFSGFFADYVSGTEELPVSAALRVVGLELRPAEGSEHPRPRGEEGPGAREDDAADTVRPGRPAYLGLTLADRGGRAVVTGVASDGPAYDAGIIVDDEVVTLDDRRLMAGDLEERLKGLEPGQVVRLRTLRRDRERLVEVALAGLPENRRPHKLVRVKDPTPEQRAAYRSWIGHAWPEE
ncbi:MAG TPA: PDZ domain-containing protein [Phycisphaerales bacterium]|nr:PDZ domain-containing protein [Phycisphaerales bacterium]